MKHIFTTLFIFTLLTSFSTLESHAADSRFIDKGDGTIYDTVSNLTWLKKADCFGNATWSAAKILSNSLASGQCGLTDGTVAGDWHLPKPAELQAFVDAGYRANTLNTVGFTSVQPWYYWSDSISYTRGIDVYIGEVGGGNIDHSNSFMWPVRSGQFWRFGSLMLLQKSQNAQNIFVGERLQTEFTIFNRGVVASNFSAQISGVDATQFTVAPGGTTQCASLTPTLGAGESCTLLVTATPTTAGTKTANLITTTTSGSKEIPLDATAIATVYGVVTDQSTGLPVSGATVTLNTTATATTSAMGSYTFANLPVATYTISVTKTGYQPATRSGLVVTVTTSSKADILLPSVGSLVTITSTSLLPWASPNVAYSSRVRVAGGTAPYTFNKAYGALPTGLSLDTTTGTISGTPTGSGSYTIAIGVTDTGAGYSEKEFTIDLLPSLQITTATLANGKQGQTYTSSITATGGKSAYNFSLINWALPSGLTLSASGVINGIPLVAGSYFIKVKLIESTGVSAEKLFAITLSLADELTFNTQTIPAGTAGIPYTTTLLASGGVQPRVFSTAGTLPAGLTLSSSGVFTGTPRESGTFNIAVTLTDSIKVTKSKTYTLIIAASALTLNTTSLPQGYIGTPYTTSLSASGGVPSRTFSITGTLPTGLSLNSSTGVISGTPSAVGFTNLIFTVTDYSYPTAQTASVTLPLRIWNALSISTTSIPAGTQKTAYSTALSGVGGATPHSWSIATGTLPQGLTVDSTTGTLSGTPTGCGTFPVTARLTDSAAVPKSVDKALSFTIACSNNYTISGNAGAAGASVSYSGSALGSVTADSSGNYSIGPLLNGTYTITPSKTLYIFTPTSSTAIVNNLDLSAAAFTGALDKTAPTVTGFTIPAASTTLAFTVSSFTATDNAAVTGYMLTGTATAPAATATGWSSTATTSFTFAGIPDGVATAKTLYAWAKDAAGNVSNSATATTTITLPDVTKPVVTAFNIPTTGTSLTVPVSTFTATDNAAVTGYLITDTATAPAAIDAGWNVTKPTSYAFTGISEGIATQKTLYAWARDAAGNVSLSLSAITTITLSDVTKPTVTGFTIPATGTSLTVAVSILTANDNVAVTGYLLTETATAPLPTGTGWSQNKPASYIFSNIPDGIATQKTLYAWAKDAAGLVSTSAIASTTITLPDVTAPVITTFTIPTSAPLTVPVTTFTATDNVAVSGYCITETNSSAGCGWGTTAPTNYAFTTAGSKTLYAWAKDGAGNISLPVSATVAAVSATLKSGDCDNSGTVSIAEVQSAINMFLGLKMAEACVDQDGSGGVTIAEVQKAINSFLGL